MNRLVIPSILTATVLIAGIFALMPIEKASTVHTTIQATTARISSATLAVSVALTDVTITCPAASDGCHILEILVDDDDAGAGDEVTIDNILLNAFGEVNVVLIAYAPDETVDGNPEALPQVSGLAIAGGDSLVINVITDGTDSADYDVTVVAEVEGGTTIGIA